MKRIDFESERTKVIGEVAQAHDGSLGLAHAYIDAIANAGADGVKFQTHIAAAEGTRAEKWRVKFSRQDKTRFDYWRRMEFTADQWEGLRRHALERELLFICSPFSVEAVELLDSTGGVSAWKVASGEVSNRRLIEAIKRSPAPVILSSGMSSFDELDGAVASIREAGLPLCVLQCTSSYPSPPQKIGLNVMEEFARRYGHPVGLSDHSGTIYPGLSAATLGASVLEVHVTLSREMFGPDVTSSITTAELQQLTEGTKFVGAMLANPVSKDDVAKEMKPLRALFTKSLVAAAHLEKGTILREEHLALKKPGTGLPYNRISEVTGKKLLRDLEQDALIQPEALGEA